MYLVTVVQPVQLTWSTLVLHLGLGPAGGRRYFTSSCTLSAVSRVWGGGDWTLEMLEETDAGDQKMVGKCERQKDCEIVGDRRRS